ncbi:MAG: TrmB family transcriptional regulator [Spirochaetales bacterium]|nr:TrmB family transcriptional regulator [Spirochaetales bacterium]
MVVNIIEQLKELGLSEYEGKIYTTLLKESPLTAYEAAKRAGIPSSKVYGVIDKLSTQEILLEVPDGAKKKFAPIDPKDLVENYRFHINQTLDTLAENLKKEKQEEDNYIWNIHEYASFIEKAERLIAEGESSILISLWVEELDMVKPFLQEKVTSGVKTAVVLFGGDADGPGQVFPHPIKDTLYNERGGRGFALVVDSKTAITGTIRGRRDVTGAFSRDPGFILLAEDYIKHDIYIMKIVRRFDKLLLDTFGPGYKKLRDIFTDEEEIR